MDPIERAANIKSQLFERGFWLNDLDKKYGLRRNSISRCLREPNAAAEVALGQFFETPPHKLFPERYDEKGERLVPQPRCNYSRPSTMLQRRKSKAA